MPENKFDLTPYENPKPEKASPAYREEYPFFFKKILEKPLLAKEETLSLFKEIEEAKMKLDEKNAINKEKYENKIQENIDKIVLANIRLVVFFC